MDIRLEIKLSIRPGQTWDKQPITWRISDIWQNLWPNTRYLVGYFTWYPGRIKFCIRHSTTGQSLVLLLLYIDKVLTKFIRDNLIYESGQGFLDRQYTYVRMHKYYWTLDARLQLFCISRKIQLKVFNSQINFKIDFTPGKVPEPQGLKRTWYT